MSDTSPRYTLHGSPTLEQRLRSLVAEIADRVSDVVPSSNYRSLVLLGGYGRGEGGVEVRGGEERPHNNLDFLLITSGLRQNRQLALRRQVDDALEPLREVSGMGIDFSTINEAKLQRSPCLVMWYDMRFGHRTILGDDQFVPGLEQFTADKVPAWDILNLLVNRGTLLVINDWLLAHRSVVSPLERRTIIRHIMKAIIGYGDALLYFCDRYHWSYAEKQRRMATTWEAPQAFRSLYEEAIAFRFQPDYARYADRDLIRWRDDLRETLASVHLQCEETRLRQRALDWSEYLVAALTHALWRDSRSPRALAKMAVNLLRGPRCQVPGSLAATLGARASGMRGLLPILFPVIAYELDCPALRAVTCQALGATNDSPQELRRGYLRAWGRCGDDNFASFLHAHGLSLEPDSKERTSSRLEPSAVGDRKEPAREESDAPQETHPTNEEVSPCC